MRTAPITSASPLTDGERNALARLRSEGPLIVGQQVILNSPRAAHLNRSQVLTSIARGLQRRGLVDLQRMPRGPMLMTLPKGNQ